MRNLKKVLSLALALVMLIGMMVVGAGAATSFKDDDKIQNQEAVAVLVGMGIMKGRVDDSTKDVLFDPAGTLTRAEAAKMIAQLDLGVVAADALKGNGTSPFSDVWSGYWAEGAIDYCVEQGYITGDGAGHFYPGNKVSSVEFGIMLLRLLGYDAKVEGLVGSQWATKGAALARKAGLTVAVAANTEPMTRDAMAQMAFNALTASMVEYEGMDITIGDVAINARVKVRTHSVDQGGLYSNKTYNGKTPTPTTPIRLCEERFPDLKLETGSRDSFKREYSVWTWKKVDIAGSKVLVKADAEFTAETSASAVSSAINGATGARADTPVYVNGKQVTTIAGTDVNADLIASWTENGRQVLVYLDESNHKLIEKVVVVDTFVAQVNSVGSDSITLNLLGDTQPATTAVSDLQNASKADVYSNRLSLLSGSLASRTVKTTGFAAGDLVTYTAAYGSNGKYSIVADDVALLSDPVTGTLTAWKGSNLVNDNKVGNSNSSFTVDSGDPYKYSVNNVVVDSDGGVVSIVDFAVNKSEINVYVDKYGYAIYVSGVEVAKNYAAVIGMGSSNQYGSETRGVTLLLPDNTTAEVTAKMSAADWAAMTVQAGGDDAGKNLVTDGLADVVTYTVDDKGVYTLSRVALPRVSNPTPTQYTGMYKVPTAGKKPTFTNGKSLMTIEGTAYYTTNRTIFMVGAPAADGYTYSVYTGYANAPSITDDTTVNGIAFGLNRTLTSQIDVVYIDASGLSNATGNEIYFAFNKDLEIQTTSNGSFVTVPAVVDGKVEDIMISATLKKVWDGTEKELRNSASGLYVIDSVVRNDAGIITNCVVKTKGTQILSQVAGTQGVIKAGYGVIGFGQANTTDAFWAYTDSSKGYYIDKDYKTITETAIGSFATDKNDIAWANGDSAVKKVDTLFVVEVEGNEAPSNTYTVRYTVDGGDVQTATVTNGNSWTYTFEKNIDTATVNGSSTGITIDGNKITVTETAAKSGTIVIKLKTESVSEAIDPALRNVLKLHADDVKAGVEIAEAHIITGSDNVSGGKYNGMNVGDLYLAVSKPANVSLIADGTANLTGTKNGMDVTTGASSNWKQTTQVAKIGAAEMAKLDTTQTMTLSKVSAAVVHELEVKSDVAGLKFKSSTPNIPESSGTGGLKLEITEGLPAWATKVDVVLEVKGLTATDATSNPSVINGSAVQVGTGANAGYIVLHDVGVSMVSGTDYTKTTGKISEATLYSTANALTTTDKVTITVKSVNVTETKVYFKSDVTGFTLAETGGPTAITGTKFAIPAMTMTKGAAMATKANTVELSYKIDNVDTDDATNFGLTRKADVVVGTNTIAVDGAAHYTVKDLNAGPVVITVTGVKVTKMAVDAVQVVDPGYNTTYTVADQGAVWNVTDGKNAADLTLSITPTDNWAQNVKVVLTIMNGAQAGQTFESTAVVADSGKLAATVTIPANALTNITGDIIRFGLSYKTT